MKKIIFSLFCFCGLASFSQKQIPDTSKPIEIIEIINADITSIDEIYNRSLLWVSDNFRDSKSAIRVSDKVAGIINGHAYYTIDFKSNPNKTSTMLRSFEFKWKIEMKANKARFSIYDIIYIWNEPNYKYPLTENEKCPYYGFKSKVKMNEEWASLKTQFKNRILETIDSYKIAITNTRDKW